MIQVLINPAMGGAGGPGARGGGRAAGGGGRRRRGVQFVIEVSVNSKEENS
jgi:hypothetical protein